MGEGEKGNGDTYTSYMHIAADGNRFNISLLLLKKMADRNKPLLHRLWSALNGIASLQLLACKVCFYLSLAIYRFTYSFVLSLVFLRSSTESVFFYLYLFVYSRIYLSYLLFVLCCFAKVLFSIFSIYLFVRISFLSLSIYLSIYIHLCPDYLHLYV